MHLAVLMTNTDESSFAQSYAKDGEKFANLVHSVRPDWAITSFDVKDGLFPKRIADFDGLIITGSPASVRDEAGWISDLMDLIRAAHATNFPMFGACFGHQAIAAALGGEIDYNPEGWIFGLTEVDVVKTTEWTKNLPPVLNQYAAHKEQVTKLPQNSDILISSPACPIGGFAIDKHIYTTQNHPEMTPEFIDALVEEYADHLGSSVAQTARASLSKTADNAVYAETIAQFFEVANAV